MTFTFKSTDVLYALGVLLGIATILYFSVEVVLSFAPAVKSTLLFCGFVAFLAAGIAASRTLAVTFYVLAAATYVVFLGYTLLRFDFGTDAIFVSLAASSVLFVALGYLVREWAVSRRRVGTVLLTVIIVAAAVSAFDIVGAEPTYTLELEDEVDLSGRSYFIPIGTVTAENSFVLARTADVPTYRACVYTPEKRRVYVETGNLYGPVLLDSGESREFRVRMEVPPLPGGQRNAFDAVPVERAAECPDTSTERKIVVVQQSAGVTTPTYTTPATRFTETPGTTAVSAPEASPTSANRTPLGTTTAG